ncbi:hypothetical protein [Phenylobacterium sp.]|uniref:hypothetical protein n=1 Tax=Phenylobacterium sp. TaxID=1871053 RepID=UPI002C97FD16|nr:hypothetical protein [Phenylobacterium sp.]HLZ73426.1 hypothetical protein [Phenylobacterium sp.]
MIARAVLRLASLCLFVSLVASAAVQAEPYNPAHLPPQRLDQVGAICRTVIGVRPGFTLYDNCVEALSQSAAGLDRAGALQAARSACLARGETQGPKLAECELAEAGATRVAAGAAIDASEPRAPAKSWFYASGREMRRREEQACARLGYEPARGAFSSCVAGLDAALYAADHPHP